MNGFAPSRRMTAVKMPPIAAIMDRIRQLQSSGRKVFSMAQAVPWYLPPSRLLREFANSMGNSSMHRYSPDPGYLRTRMAVAEDFRRRRGIDLDPEQELHITVGASQAFLSALLTATSGGDSVAVLEPYYFDHIFAVQFSELDLVSVPMTEEGENWLVPPMDRLEKVMEAARVLVIVNPGNPTGMVIPDRVMERITEMAVATSTFLIIDETYERFVFTGDSWHPWKKRKHDHVLTVGSFSKSLGIPGWRIGYLFGSPELLKQAIKVQDSVVICPPSPSQLLLEMMLSQEEWIEEAVAGVRKRLDICRKALRENGSLQWREAGGAFFTLASFDSGMNSQEVSMHLLNEYGIGTIPGSAFGRTGEGHVRISFGCLSDSELEPAMELLSGVSVPG